MSKLKHTPGPWKFDSEPHRMRIEDNSYCVVCDMCASASAITRSKEEIFSNARLIAAAPEMLDALITVKKYGCSGYIEGSKTDIEFWFKIDNAIKKAAGLSIEEVLNAEN